MKREAWRWVCRAWRSFCVSAEALEVICGAHGGSTPTPSSDLSCSK